MKRILFISTNAVWGGSEILWFQSAKMFIANGYEVAVVTEYNNSEIDNLNLSALAKFNLNDRYKQPGLFYRIVAKFLRSSFKKEDKLLSFIKAINPDLIIISQGNNIDSLPYQKLFSNNNFKYCTITQLVTEFHWLSINNESLNELQNAYAKSSKNFFISKANIELHNKMIVRSFDNSELVYNPGYEDSSLPDYPKVEENYNLAFVGRIECFHKGLDILLQVISDKKWQNRNLSINIYGNGPHYNWIKQTIENLKISNVYLKGFASDIKDVWKENHLLILPSRMEGQSLALIEAQMYGRAAVATNVGGASEIIDDNISGFLAAFPNAVILDEALERAWAQRENWQQIGQLAQKKIREEFPKDVINYFNSKVEEVLKKS